MLTTCRMKVDVPPNLSGEIASFSPERAGELLSKGAVQILATFDDSTHQFDLALGVPVPIPAPVPEVTDDPALLAATAEVSDLVAQRAELEREVAALEARRVELAQLAASVPTPPPTVPVTPPVATQPAPEPTPTVPDPASAAPVVDQAVPVAQP